MATAWHEHELSGWSRRALAWCIDAVILSSAAAVIFLVYGAGGESLSVQTALGGDISFLARAAVSWGLGLVYFPPIMTLTDGQTVGKWMLGIRVVRTDGRHMTASLAAIRDVLVKEIVWGLSFFAFGLIDGLWPLWDRENRALHDMVARTRVIRVRQEVPSPVTAV